MNAQLRHGSRVGAVPAYGDAFGDGKTHQWQ
jgi:hypothetical protein